MVNFTDLLSRADAALLQELIGPGVVQLLFALDPEKAGPANLRSILLGMRPAAELLLSKSTRPRMLELLRPSEAQQGCGIRPRAPWFLGEDTVSSTPG
jgi:hypothetical protein